MWFPMLRRPIQDKANTTNNSHMSNMYDKKLNKKLQHNINVFKDIFNQDDTIITRQ